jgi:hypothetical protein
MQSVIYTQIFTSRVRFSHAEWDFHSKSVTTVRSVILTRTNIMMTPTTVTSTRTRVIYTRRVWFILRHIHSECIFHVQCDFEPQKCDYDTHDCDFNTENTDFYTQSIIYAHRVRFSHATWDFYTQSVISTRTNAIATLTTVILTHSREISTRRVWFIHSVIYGECDFHSHELNFNTMRVTNQLKSTENYTHESSFHITLVMCVFLTLMRVILTHYVLNYFITIYIHKPKLQVHTCGRHACRINTLRSIVTLPYCMSVQHAYVKIQHACVQVQDASWVFKIYILIW